MKKRAPAFLGGVLMTIIVCGPARAQLSAPPPPPPGAQADNVTAIPAGTQIRAELSTLLSTKTSKDGDQFTARVVEPVFSKGEEIIPEGSTLEGHVSYLKEPGRVKGVGEMRLIADSITTPSDIVYSVAAGLQNAEGGAGAKVKGDEGTLVGQGKDKKGAAKETGVAAGVGAGVGAIADGGTGSLYGAGIGAAAALAHTLFKKHKDLVVTPGTELGFEIPRTVPGKKMAKSPD